MESITIRKVIIRELEQLKDISKQTFYETFSSDNTEENMQKQMREALLTQKLREEIKDPDTDFYFAILDKEVIGYLKLNTGDAETDIKDGDAIEIERI